MLSTSGITENDYIISCIISQFVQRAFKEDENFNQKPFETKKRIIAGYADEIIKENSAKEELKAGIESQLNPAENPEENPDDGEGSEENPQDNWWWA